MRKQETLEDLIVESGLKLEVIANRIGISYNYFYRLRKQPTKMDADLMVKLAEVLGVDSERVFEAIKSNGD